MYIRYINHVISIVSSSIGFVTPPGDVKLNNLKIGFLEDSLIRLPDLKQRLLAKVGVGSMFQNK